MLLLPLYSIGFSIALVALLGWFYFQRKAGWGRLFQLALFAGLALYLGSIVSASAPLDFKLGVLFRDLMVIGGAGFLFQFLLRKHPAFLFGLLALGIVLFWFYRNQLSQTFPYQAPLEVDQEAELLIELKEGADLAVLDAITRKYDLHYEKAFTMQDPGRTGLDDYYAVDIPARLAKELRTIEGAFNSSGFVTWVEPNEVIHLETPVTGSLPEKVRRKFGIDDPGIENLWGFEAMEVDKLLGYLKKKEVKPQRKALIAVLDTGVDGKHEDIKDNYRSIKSGHNNDPRGHGTHCAGIAAAVSNNGKGVASFSRDNNFVEVASIKVLSAMGSGTQRGIINGMLEATDKGADVISMSLGGRSSQSRQRAYSKAVKYANDAGAIVVAAAGNSNSNAKDYAPVNANGAIGVSAIDEEGRRASFSNTVSDIKMGIAAPGVNIYSTIPGDQYATYSGTSMATPYVAGMVGLLKAIRPDLSTAQVHSLLVRTGADTKATKETGKLIQPYDAVRELVEKGI